MEESYVDCGCVFSPVLHYIMRPWQQDSPLVGITLYEQTGAFQYFNIPMTQTRDLPLAGIS
jgi:hypothetical protein